MQSLGGGKDILEEQAAEHRLALVGTIREELHEILGCLPTLQRPLFVDHRRHLWHHLVCTERAL